MQAVILAGGLGTRLWPLTKDVPKPMVPVAGVPYLEHQLRRLREQSVLDIVLLTGYLGEQIEDYFGDGSRMGLSIAYSRERTPLGTGGALREASPLLADTFLVIYGDSYLPIDYPAVLRQLESSSADGLLVVYDNGEGDTSVKNNVNLDADGFVRQYEKDSSEALAYVEAGVLAFRKRVVNLIAAEGIVSLEKAIFPKLIARHCLIAHATRQRFYDIGTPERLQAIERLLAHDHHQDTISH
jgi:NDP-sugar pyrophosphorylase family protein